MNTVLIGKSWDKLAGKHHEVVSSFYSRFFEKYPDYKPMFPDSMNRHMTKMVETLALVARVSDETEVVHPHILKLGHKHNKYHLGKTDMERFKQVFLEVVAKYCGDDWTDDCLQAWTEAFDRHVIPYMVRGLRQA